MLNKLSFKNQVNAVGGLAFLVAGGFFAHEFTRSRETKPCGARYPVATQLSLQKPNGEPFSPGDLQGRAGQGEHGILEKATVIPVMAGPAPLVLDVKVGGAPENDTGASFYWAPTGLGKATSACLSYQVFLAEDFDFATGGKLPGVYGSGRGGAQRGFSTRFTWDPSGRMGIEANLSDYDPASSLNDPIVYRSSAAMPRGRWVQLDQEITLNTPNAQNGSLRLWVDGKLRLEDNGMAWRSNGGLSISGALTDIGYLPGSNHEAVAKKPTSVIVSPPQLSWN